MAAKYSSEVEVASTLKKNSFSESFPRDNRSLSDSGRKVSSFKDQKIKGGGFMTDFVPQNEHRVTAFDSICEHLGTLHKEPLSVRDWEHFKSWCDNYNNHTASNTQTSPKAADIYQKCRMIMIDVFGKWPEEEEWKDGKDWYMARHQSSSRSKKNFDQGDDSYYNKDIPMDTTELQREQSLQERQHGMDRHTRGDNPKSETRRVVDHLRQKQENTEQSLQERQHGMDRHTRGDNPKSETRRVVDHLRQKQENTDSEVDQLKKKIDDLEKQMKQVLKENKELSRCQMRPLPFTGKTNEGGRDEMDEDSSDNKNRRGRPLAIIGLTNQGTRDEMDEESNDNYNNGSELKVEELQMECGQLTREIARKDKEISDLKSTNVTLSTSELKVEELQMECGQLTREIARKDKEISDLKSTNVTLSTRVDVLEKECEQLHLDMKNQDHLIEREKSNSRILQARIEEMDDNFKCQMNIARRNHASKDEYIQRLEEEKADALRRLSTLASAKLSDNNPDITDLSDMNRPQKIAEKYSELYDNEWTDAYEYLNANGRDHEKTVSLLLNVLESCFQYCKSVGRRQYEHLLVMACSPSLEQKDQGLGAVGGTQAVQTYEQTITQKVVELRKVAFKHSLRAIEQAYQIDKGRDIDHPTSQEISTYLEKCLEVSWLACIQDPPLEIVSDFPPYSRVDLNIVRKYTKSGEFVEYVIWPALLLSNNGALLSKGVVQCTSKSQDFGTQPPHHQQVQKPSNTNHGSEV